MEKLLAFHLAEDDLTKLKKIADNIQIRLEIIEPADYFQPLENLVNDRQDSQIAPFTGKVPEESLLLFCGFTDRSMEDTLAALRAGRVQVSYKAALTPTNQKWNFLQLLLEMRMESGSLRPNLKHTSPT